MTTGRRGYLHQLDVVRLLTFGAVIGVHAVAFTEPPSSPHRGLERRRRGRYVAAHDLIVNPLLGRGYDSVGCAPCTRPGRGREGRWAGTDKTECGLHVA